MNLRRIFLANTNYLVQNIEYYKEIESTHLYAKSIANKEDENGKLIIADVQKNGIGTNGRNWYTGEGKNIAMTLILKPKAKIQEYSTLTVDIAKAMQNAIKELYNIDLTIKEPNDLMLNGKKICGILTEASTAGEKINYLLISVGFNVNEVDFVEDIINTATSLKKELKLDYSRERIIAKFLEKLGELIKK